MAVTNISSKEKTIKNMYQLLDSDNYTVDKFIFYCKYNGDDVQVELGNILDNYRDYFDQFLISMTIPEKFFYQPAAFAENYYGTPDLDFLVLYFAKMNSLFQFNKKEIKVLPKDKILEINRLMVQYKEAVTKSYNEPSKYLEETYLKIYK